LTPDRETVTLEKKWVTFTGNTERQLGSRKKNMEKPRGE